MYNYSISTSCHGLSIAKYTQGPNLITKPLKPSHYVQAATLMSYDRFLQITQYWPNHMMRNKTVWRRNWIPTPADQNYEFYMDGYLLRGLHGQKLLRFMSRDFEEMIMFRRRKISHKTAAQQR